MTGSDSVCGPFLTMVQYRPKDTILSRAEQKEDRRREGRREGRGEEEETEGGGGSDGAGCAVSLFP